MQNIGRKILPSLVLSVLLLAMLPGQSQAESRVLVRYLHGTIRCATCMQFEAWAKAATEGFAEELADGRLQWQLINFDLPENKHYLQDYGLTEKALVLVREEDGRTVRWKNIEEFWDFGDDQKREFIQLLQSQIADFLNH